MKIKIILTIIFLLFTSCSPKKNSGYKNNYGMEFTYINPGIFEMGTNYDELYDLTEKIVPKDKFRLIEKFPSFEPDKDEKQQNIKIGKGFFVQITEVTQGQWFDIMGTKPWDGMKYVKEGKNFPAVYVSWSDAKQFVEQLNKIEKTNKYRLPTEVEWEYVCRAGTKSIYFFNIINENLKDYAWYDSNTLLIGENFAHEAKQKKPNPWGLFDIYGNVWEWCEDWYDQYPTLESKSIPKNREKVFRGGGWDSNIMDCRSAERNSANKDFKDYSLGFRIVMDK